MITKNSKIFIAGHNGLVGGAILRCLKKNGYKNIITADRSKLDLINQQKVLTFLKKNKPKFIFLCAAKVGGILCNSKYKAEMIYENLVIQTNIIHSAYLSGIKDLIFLGSSCVYPRNCKQPIKEEYLLNGILEKTNDAYAIAKIAGIKMCESYNLQYGTNYKCIMPTNTFGPNDKYDTLNSHFFPSLIKKIYNLKDKDTLTLWGNGKPKREAIYVDDLADACIFFMKKKTKHSLINIGSGIEKSIEQYARFIIKKLGLKVNIKFDKSKPNGTPRKLLNSHVAISYGWRANTNLDEGFDKVYQSYLLNY